jgi:hypothetical protein
VVDSDFPRIQSVATIMCVPLGIRNFTVEFLSSCIIENFLYVFFDGVFRDRKYVASSVTVPFD